jgi:hypothetical protein
MISTEQDGDVIRIYCEKVCVARFLRPREPTLDLFTRFMLACGVGVRLSLCCICLHECWTGDTICGDCRKVIAERMRGHMVRVWLVGYLPVSEDVAGGIRAAYYFSDDVVCGART